MPVILTENAASQVKKFQEEHQFPTDAFLRIGLVAGGCSGFSYSLAFDDKYDEEKDSKYEQHGISIVVDKKSALYLDGTTVDWHERIDRQGFSFENPQARKSCGCGSSFSV